MRVLTALIVTIGTIAGLSAAQAQSWPSRPISVASGSYSHTALFRTVFPSLIGQPVVPFGKKLQIKAR